MAHPDDPGRYLIATGGEVPVLPRKQAVRHLEKRRFAVSASTRTDARTDEGSTQVAATSWTAPCHPAA
ncbi:hypothetical protein LK07_22110 [Streptomyces pluripotens]|uniref:Uncharacterized protein n=1 Tax=Streptomyces pluripotens TaxID=1355015 RepID=A0A221P225_9ACTN|nr:hypothetical protein [Streptomyces pluripotens]ARP72010.1 hypothetical protein LK06_020950 [Streptomyces pluripotens]ASN26260.1 hypothetical protein LK07_22110 [Streptomyces pluripotens]